MAVGYDNNGNLTSDNGAIYQYDDENRLRSTSGTLPGNWRYLHADHQSSIIAHSNASGSQLATLMPTAFPN